MPPQHVKKTQITSAEFVDSDTDTIKRELDEEEAAKSASSTIGANNFPDIALNKLVDSDGESVQEVENKVRKRGRHKSASYFVWRF